MTQLILHLFGDYILQSNWMAVNKSKHTLPCFLHCLTYTLPFLLLTHSLLALTVIFVTHFAIDRTGAARYLVWLKNWQAPDGFPRWEWCSMTGYFDPEVARVDPREMSENDPSTPAMEELNRLNSDKEMVRPVWLRVWLLIVADNTLHLACNYLALAYL